MASFVTTSTAARSPAATFAYIVDLANWPTFRGYGPLPGIVRAELPPGEAMAVGARVRVTNTDGSVHHEVVEEHVPARRYRVRMELGEPARRLLARIDETVELEAIPDGTLIRRRFDVTPRSAFTAPLAWLIARLLLRRAVERHNEAVAQALVEEGSASKRRRLSG
jgi:hypothetical protein